MLERFCIYQPININVVVKVGGDQYIGGPLDFKVGVHTPPPPVPPCCSAPSNIYITN